MTTATGHNPLKGKARADNGGGFEKTEIPSAETHDARVVALIDLGTHNESYKGETPKPKRSLYLVFELDEEMTGMKGVNHVVGVKYTLSFHEKATLRQLAEALLNEGEKYAADEEVDYRELLGKPCTVQISHKSGTGEKADRQYSVVGTIAPVNRKKRDGWFKPKRELATWFVGQPLNELPDYLPRIYGETVEDVVRRCHEVAGKPAAGAASSDEGNPADGEADIPF